MLFFTANTSWADCMSGKPEKIAEVLKILECFQKEINELKESKSSKGSAGKIIINTFLKIKKPSTSKNINVGSFKIDLLECKRNITKVICSFVIENLGEDREFSIQGKPHGEFYDELGDNYKIASVNMNRDSSKKFITNIPVNNITVTFNDIPENITQFVRFKLSTSKGYGIFNHLAIIK